MKKTLFFAACILLSVAFPAHANLNNALNSMFSSNVTSPGAYNSASRSGWVGGGVSLRTPVKPINLVAFDPVRLSAGCGGIDMYGGSFTFINKDQFTQLLRNIMNNALGLLFQAAIDAIDPSISKLMTQFQKTVQDLNQLASNTCAIANQTINSIKNGALDNDMREAGAKVLAHKGTITGIFDGEHPETPAQDKANMQDAEADNPNAGNYTWRALQRSQIADSIGAVGAVVDATDPNGNKSKRFVMSLIGTTINTSFGQEANPANNAVSTSQETVNPYITLYDIFSGDDLKVWSCSGPALGGDADAWGQHSCVALTTDDFEMPNMHTYVRNMLYGDSTLTSAADIKALLEGASHPSPSTPGQNSIYGRILNCATNGCGMNAQELAFLNMAGPVFNLVKDAQYDPNTLPMLTEMLVSPLAAELTVKLGEASVRAARLAWRGVKDVTMPANVNANIISLTDQIGGMNQVRANLADNLNKAKAVADNIRMSIPTIGVK